MFLHRGYSRYIRKTYLLSLKQHITWLTTVIESVPIPMYVVNKDGHTIIANKAFIDCFPNYNKGDIMGVSYKFFADMFGIKHEKTLTARALNGEAIHKERVNMLNRKWLASAFPIRDEENNQIVAAVGVFHDITEYENYQNEIIKLDRLEVVGQIAASVAHEIRNPMTVIRGYIQRIQQKTGEEFLDQFNLVLEELDRANRIINDFLSVARNKYIETERVSLNDIIDEITPLITSETLKRGLDINLNLLPTLPFILANREEMKQIIFNLAVNSMDAMEPHGILTIETNFDDDKVFLIVEDTGCGIPENELDKIFEPFYTTKKEGTGLGLPVCKSIVERHNGHIEVLSERGKGTRFKTEFPLP